jgi:hypothetical protein
MKVAQALKSADKQSVVGTGLTALATVNLDPQEQEFIRLYNAAAGTIAGLGPITRGNKTDRGEYSPPNERNAERPCSPRPRQMRRLVSSSCYRKSKLPRRQGEQRNLAKLLAIPRRLQRRDSTRLEIALRSRMVALSRSRKFTLTVRLLTRRRYAGSTAKDRSS